VLLRSSTSSSETAALRRFSIKLGAFLALQCLIALAVLAPFHAQRNDTYMAELDDKQQRLEVAIGPRLILVGGSNLAFSFDSQRAMAQTALTPVNLGLHKGLGVEFMLNQARRQVRRGDVVVVALEYSHYLNDRTSDIIAEAATMAPYALWSGMDFTVFQKTSDQALAILGRRTRTLALMALGVSPYRPLAPYRHDSFNGYGEVTEHRSLGPQPRRPSPLLRLDETRIQRMLYLLNDFAADCADSGARVYLTYAPYPQSDYARDADVLGQIHQRLVDDLHFPVITAPVETVYPDDWFFDTEYHTLSPGTLKRTDLLMKRLAAVQREQQPE
jgi:hypothetical protein